MHQLFLIISLPLLFVSCISNKDIDITQFPEIVTAKDLMNYYVLSLDTTGKFEKSAINKYFDGSIELDYEYDLTDTYEHDPLYYSITISKEKNSVEATKSYFIEKKIFLAANNVGGFDNDLIDTLDLPGSHNYYAIRNYKGQPNGILFMMVKEKYMYTLITSGLYSDDHSIMYDLILPSIENIEELELSSN